MSSLTSVTLVTSQDTSIQYNAIQGIWVNVQANEHVGFDTVEVAMPKLKAIKFGNLELTPKDWKAMGCPFVLTPNELATVEKVVRQARRIEDEKQIQVNVQAMQQPDQYRRRTV
jgi:hypothetical protein